MGDEHRGARVRCTQVHLRAFGVGRPLGGNAGALGTARCRTGVVPSLAADAHPNPAFERTARTGRGVCNFGAGRRSMQR